MPHIHQAFHASPLQNNIVEYGSLHFYSCFSIFVNTGTKCIRKHIQNTRKHCYKNWSTNNMLFAVTHQLKFKQLHCLLYLPSRSWYQFFKAVSRSILAVRLHIISIFPILCKASFSPSLIYYKHETVSWLEIDYIILTYTSAVCYLTVYLCYYLYTLCMTLSVHPEYGFKIRPTI